MKQQPTTHRVDEQHAVVASTVPGSAPIRQRAGRPVGLAPQLEFGGPA